MSRSPGPFLMAPSISPPWATDKHNNYNNYSYCNIIIIIAITILS